LFCDGKSQEAPAASADIGIGEAPSPIITVGRVAEGVVLRPLAAEIAPATMRLANNPRNTFFTIELSLPEVELNLAKTRSRVIGAEKLSYTALIRKEADWLREANDYVRVVRPQTEVDPEITKTDSLFIRVSPQRRIGRNEQSGHL
jgi:hypothetical protein